MKEHFNKIMQNGGFAVIVAVVAMLLYLAVVDGAQKCSADSIEPVEIEVDENGILSLHYIYADKDELMVLWETDGGSLSPIEASGNNLDYFLYRSIDEKIVWNSEDADSNKYEIATVRAILYEKTEGKSEYYISKDIPVSEFQITLTYKDGKVVKAEDRMFSNPVRKDSDKNWNQIYLIDENEDGLKTYRYRTGNDIPDEEYLYLRWEADNKVLCETDIHNGLKPKVGILNSNKNKNKLIQINTISIKEDAEKSTISAFIVTGDDYEKDKIKEENKINKAELEIN